MKDHPRFQDKVVVVTGASRGIGKEIAVRFGAEGGKVACVATSEANALSTATAIYDSGGVARAYGCDVGEADQVEATFSRITEELGPPEILVNNAGLARDALLMRMKDEDWERVLAVNLKGAYLCIKAASRAMMKARYGRILNVTSIIGTSGGAGQANYAAAKAGLIGLTKSVAKELGGRGITCNAVAPGFIETDMTADLPEEMREKIAATAPLGRLGQASDVAGVVLFFCSDDAGYVTGQTLVVDGGLTL
ncbi:MAG TPA: 3-oxoacyl-[acyl-carrier-protein] reductase [Fimbriimonadaceae bacterium]|nr:3-oxoacyl-[acyl-carrier-protein] reductase [Fimbriimonadaceae bacterium]HRJ95595.1 3-oxoacyl-[acyl-carrier-protein] reductase [Fimbriimonadaceae bacterium]